MRENRIKEFRINKGITLNEEREYQHGYICHLEKGTRKNPSIEVMKSIAKALDVKVPEVFFLE